MRNALVLLLFTLPISAEEPREPVPAGALQRLGTSRFRAEDDLHFASYTRDEKSIIGCTYYAIVVWDAETGLKTRTIQFFKESDYKDNRLIRATHFAYDPVRECLAVGVLRWGDRVDSRQVQYWDLKTGRKKFAFENKHSDDYEIGWTPEGHLVLVSTPDRDTQVVVVRDKAGAELYNWSKSKLGGEKRFLDKFCVLGGNRLAMFDGENRPVVRNLATGLELVSFPDEDIADYYTRLAGSSDGKLLAVGNQKRCTIYKSATGKKVAEIKGDDSSDCQLAFSPDGKTIYYGSSNVRGFDAVSGKPLPAFPWDSARDCSHHGTMGGIAPPGEKLLFYHYATHVVTRVDARTGKPFAAPPGHADNARLVWMPDGKTLLVRAYEENAWSVWNLETGQRERTFAPADPKGYHWYRGFPVCLSADGRELFDLNFNNNAKGFGRQATVYDTATGAVRRKFFVPGHPLAEHDRASFDAEKPHRVLLSELVLEKGSDPSLQFTWWNSATDAKEGGFGIKMNEAYKWENVGSYISVIYWPTTDAKSFDQYPPYAIHLVRTTDGKLFRSLRHSNLRYPSTISGTGDCGTLVTVSRPPNDETAIQMADPVERQTDFLHLWELASGKEISHWPRTRFHTEFEFEPRGHYLVEATDKSSFVIFEPYVSRHTVVEVKVPSPVDSFSFSPDGKRLATILKDTTIVIWDTAPWEAAIAKEMAAVRPANLASLVAQLTESPDKANAAARLLATAGDRAVDALKSAIAPAQPTAADQLRKLIANLDAPKFAAREGASKELFALGYSAEGALRAALEAKPNAEVKARLEKLLAKLDLQEYDADTLGRLRAVRVLRDIGSPAAREMLAAWAKGDAHAPQTRAALEKK